MQLLKIFYIKAQITPVGDTKFSPSDVIVLLKKDFSFSFAFPLFFPATSAFEQPVQRNKDNGNNCQCNWPIVEAGQTEVLHFLETTK